VCRLLGYSVTRLTSLPVNRFQIISCKFLMESSGLLNQARLIGRTDFLPVLYSKKEDYEAML